MIFGAIGLLVVALVLLIVGIAKSLVAPLVFSVIATMAALVMLYGSFVYYRKKALAEQGLAVDPGVEPGYPEGYSTSAPVRAGGTMMLASSARAGAGVASSNGQAAPLVERWDALSPDEAARLMEALSLDELHAVRRQEIEHRGRTPLLEAIDARIETIAALRREVGGRA